MSVNAPPSPVTADETAFDFDEIVALTRSHLNKGRASIAEILGAHSEAVSEGAYLYGHNGRRYLQCGGYGVFILGHRHPAVT